MMWALVFLVGIGVVAADRVECNNTDSFRNASEWLSFSSDLDQCRNRTCAFCAFNTDNSPFLFRWARFFDDNDCWGLPLRRSPVQTPWAVAPDKGTLIRNADAAGCDTSDISCSFAYKIGFCANCPTCPVPTPCPDPDPPTCPVDREAEVRQQKATIVGLSVVIGVFGFIALCVCLGQFYERCCKADPDAPPTRTLSSVKLERQSSAPAKSLDQIVKDRAKANRSRTPR